LLDAFDLIPTGGVDLEPFAAALLVPIVAWGLFRLHLGDIVPVAHESIVSGLQDSILVLDDQDRILAVNPAAQALMGAMPDTVVGKAVATIWPEWQHCMTGASDDVEGHWEWTRKGCDRPRTYDVHVSKIQDGKNTTVSRVVTLHDMTEHKETEREVRDRRRYLEGVLEAAPDAIVTLDAEGRVVEWNSAAVHLFGHSAAEATGQSIDALITGPAAQEAVRALARNAFGEKGLPPAKTVYHCRSGSPVYVIAAGAPIGADGELIGAVILFTDISEHKRLENELRGLNEELERRVAERTSKLRQINDELLSTIGEYEQAQSELLRRNRELLSLQAAVTATASSLDLPFVLDTVTWEMASMLGVEQCAVLHLDEETGVLSVLARHDAASGENACSIETYVLDEHPARRWVLEERTALQVTIGQPNADAAEVRHMRQRGAQCLLMQPMVFQDRVVGIVEITDGRSHRTFTAQEVSMAQLFANQAASAIENARLYERAQQEIAERLRIEERITASLREKEVMLKEIHHRVKNNLQVISSLLHLQARGIEDQDVLETLQESQHRVRSMALIHEKLYRSEDLARVDFGSYVQDLATFLFRSYRSRRGAVHLSVDADGVSLPIDAAVPCGLIINELVSNALKHAFSDGREGEIRVTLGADAARRIRLTISDNGVGFPAEVDYRETPSLGLQLVNTLVDQLDGEIELYNGKGSRFEITFAAPEAALVPVGNN
jgi:PAS domain S-box-containing protein